MFAMVNVEAKVKQSIYRPGQALKVQEVEASSIYRELAHEGGEVVSLMYGQPLLQGDIHVHVSVRG